MAKEKKVKPAAKRKAPAANGEPKGTELAPLFGAPFHNLRDEIDRVFESFMQGWPHMRAGDLLRSGGGAVPSALPLSPRADLTESDDAYEMTVELPGLETGDIDISVKNGMLTVKGEKKVEKEERK